QKVQTYIQSGNAVFVSPEKDTLGLSKAIGVEVKKRHGFEPYVLLLELEDIERAIRNNPFPEAETDPKSLHTGFLASTPEHPNLKTLESLKRGSERFRLIDRVFYLHAREGSGRSKTSTTATEYHGTRIPFSTHTMTAGEQQTS